MRINTIADGVSYSTIANQFSSPAIEIGLPPRKLRPTYPTSFGDGYAPNIAGALNGAIAKLNSSDSFENKMQSLIYILQSGIDKYHCALTGQTWPAGAGHEPGHKLAVAFAAYMLDHQGMKEKVSDNFWWENQLIKDGLFGSSSYATELNYWKYMAKDPGYNLEYWDPYRHIDGGNNLSRQINGYQIITAQNCKGAAGWLRYFPDMKLFWSDADNFIAYAKRWVEHGLKAYPDPCAPMHPDDIGKVASEWQYYGVAYGPDANNSGMCILDPNLEYYNGREDFKCKEGMKCGRFRDDRDGTGADTGQYQSSQVNEMWNLFDQSYHNLFADLNSDGAVNIFDYNIFLQNFGQTNCGNIADLNNDCNVNIFDYNLFLWNFGKSV